MNKKLFANPIFKLFIEEIEILGFKVSDSPRTGFLTYVVVEGRSNMRWWLLPLTNRFVTKSSLALFQPVVSSAKIAKKILSILSSFNLGPLLAPSKIYISCPHVFLDLFEIKRFSYAFFTGTDSPHRKIAVQIMNNIGEIKGYAKISKQKKVKELIKREGYYLEYAHSLDLNSCHLPNIIFSKDINGATILLTDTQKTAHSISPVKFTKYHEEFLSELANKSRNDEQLHSSNFLKKIKIQNDQLSTSLSAQWNTRLSLALQRISHIAPRVNAEMRTCHGDFTTWNTFIVRDKIYVFDWEYAHLGYPPGYDAVHFHLSLPNVKQQPIKEIIMQIRQILRSMKYCVDDIEADILFLCYLCGNTLQCLAREPVIKNEVCFSWTGEEAAANIIDALIETD